MSSFGLFHDINGDRCPKILMGIVELAICTIMAVIAFFYGLNHEIKAAGTIEFIIGFIGGGGFALLGITAFQKLRPAK